MTPTNGKKTLNSERVLLVEGTDEINLIGAMLSSWDIGRVQVIEVGGKDKTKTNLEIIISDARAMGIELSASELRWTILNLDPRQRAFNYPSSVGNTAN